MYFTEAYYENHPRILQKKVPRARRPLFCAHPRSKYPYPDDFEDCESYSFATTVSDLSESTLYHIRRPTIWTRKSREMGMSSIRPKKWLSSFLTPNFLDLFKRRSKARRKAQDKRAFQEQYSRVFVVNFPEDSSVDELPRQRPAVRIRPTPRRTDLPFTLEPQGRYHSRIGRPGVPGIQQRQVPRPPRLRTPVAERVPARQERRVPPVRFAGTRQPVPPRMYRYDRPREIDRGSVDAFRRVPMPQANPRRSARPRAPATTTREEQRSFGIPVPARRKFSHPECVPEPLKVIRRSPRPQREASRPRAQARGTVLEERHPRKDIRIEERWPRPCPQITKDGRLLSSAAGNCVLEETRYRPVQVKILLETRSPRSAGLNTPGRYY